MGPEAPVLFCPAPKKLNASIWPTAAQQPTC
jgi:hypothetical protein